MLFLVHIVCLNLTTTLHVHELDTILRVSCEFHMRDYWVSFRESQDLSDRLFCDGVKEDFALTVAKVLHVEKIVSIEVKRNMLLSEAQVRW